MPNITANRAITYTNFFFGTRSLLVSFAAVISVVTVKEITERFSTDMRSRKLICGPLFSFQIIKLYLANFLRILPSPKPELHEG